MSKRPAKCVGSFSPRPMATLCCPSEEAISSYSLVPGSSKDTGLTAGSHQTIVFSLVMESS